MWGKSSLNRSPKSWVPVPIPSHPVTRWQKHRTNPLIFLKSHNYDPGPTFYTLNVIQKFVVVLCLDVTACLLPLWTRRWRLWPGMLITPTPCPNERCSWGKYRLLYQALPFITWWERSGSGCSGNKKITATTSVWTRSYQMLERYLWARWRNTGCKKKLRDQPDSKGANAWTRLPGQRLCRDVTEFWSFLAFSLMNWVKIKKKKKKRAHFCGWKTNGQSSQYWR